MGSLVDTSETIRSRQQHIEAVDPKIVTEMMEQLQEGYLSSVAATAGCSIQIIDKDIWGMDVQIIRAPKDPSEQESIFFAQLKSTTQVIPNPEKDHFSYQFTKRQYFEHLTKARSSIKAILIVMTMSPRQLEWTTVDHPGLLTKRCCYWAYLEGADPKTGIAKPTVHIPTKNIFDAYAIINIFDKLERGQSLDE